MKARNVSHLLVAGLAAAAIVVPAASAGSSDRVQINGQLVQPSQVSRAQLEAGHAPSSRLVAIGGALVPPSELSEWQSRAGDKSTPATASGSGFDSGAVEITAAAIVGALALLGGAMALTRRRRSLAPA